MTAEETIVPEDEEEEVVEAPEAPETTGVPEVPERRVGPVGSVLVVGSGIAGMQASLDLADTNILVHLVEDKAGIGGWMSKLDKTFPTNDCAMCSIAPKLVTVGRHHNIVLHTNAKVTALDRDTVCQGCRDKSKCAECTFGSNNQIRRDVIE